MSFSQDARKRHAVESPNGRIPKLPPIQQFQKSSARFDNSPLLKYRRSNDMQDLLGNIVYVLSQRTTVAHFFKQRSILYVLLFLYIDDASAQRIYREISSSIYAL